MAPARKLADQLQAFCELADRLATAHEAHALLFLMERPADWSRLRAASGSHLILLAGEDEPEIAPWVAGLPGSIQTSAEIPVKSSLSNALCGNTSATS